MRDNKVKIWNANEYSKNSSPQYKAAIEYYSQYPFKGDEAVLDIGAGDGKITTFLAEKVPKGYLIGTDRSENMVKFARENHTTSNLTFEHIDAQSLNYHQQFDLIVSSFCLHWVPDKQLAFNHIANALKPNGFLLALLAIRNEFSAKIRETMIMEEKWKTYFQDFFDSSIFVKDTHYQEYALKAGLQITKYEIEEKIEYYEDKTQLSNFFRAILPHVSHLPTENLKDLFMQEFMDRYLEVQKAYTFSYTYIKLFAQLPDKK